MREEENHLCGLSRLSRRAPAGLGCPVLGFLRTRTSQQRALRCAGRSSVSCVPYLSSRSLGIAGFSPSQQGKRGKTGLLVRAYAACEQAARTPKQVEQAYKQRSAIETSFRTFREALAKTTTRKPGIRLVYVGVAFLLRNLWILLGWAVLRLVDEVRLLEATMWRSERVLLLRGWTRSQSGAETHWEVPTLVEHRITMSEEIKREKWRNLN